MTRKAISVFLAACLPLLGCGKKDGAGSSGAQSAGSTDLHNAAAMGQVEKVRELLKAGAKVDATDRSGQTPLHWAARYNSGNPCIPVLLEAGASPNAADEDGQTPLHLLFMLGSRDTIRKEVGWLIAAKANVNAPDKDQATPLHLACGWGCPACAKDLIAAGAKVEAADKDGQTPLHRAAQHGWDESIRVLVEANANLGARTKKGWSAIALAADKGQEDAIRALLQAGAAEATWNALHLAAIEGNEVRTQEAIKAHAAIDAQDVCGRTPLLWALAGSHEALARILLDAGADANLADAEKRTPAQVAARTGSAAILRRLAAARVDLNAPDADGWTPLHWAAAWAEPNAAQALLDANVSVDPRSGEGETPLLMALAAYDRLHFHERENAERIVEILAKAGADVLAEDDQGASPAQLAFRTSDKIRAAIDPRAAEAREDKLDRLLKRYAPAASPPAGPAATPPGAPAEVLTRMLEAIYRGNKGDFVSCFWGSPQEMEVIDAIFSGVQAVFSLRKAMIDAYGRKGWVEFQSGKGGAVTLPCTDVDSLKSLKFAEASDGRVSCRWPVPVSGSTSASLVKKDGKWSIEARSFYAPTAQPSDMLKMLRSMSEVVAETKSKIGKPGMGPKELAEDQNSRLMKVFFGGG